MGKLKLEIEHDLGGQEAKKRIVAAIVKQLARRGEMAEDVRMNWSGDVLDFSGRIQGLPVSGRMTVGVDRVAAILDLPPEVMLFSGMIRQYFVRELEKVLA